MFIVYVLYSFSAGKFYTGYTGDLIRRIAEHNITGITGFTIRYRPWTLIHTESFYSKQEAMKREKFLKTGKGREEVATFLQLFIEKNNGAVSAPAETD